MEAQEAVAMPPPGGAAGASRPQFISLVEVDGVVSVRERQTDV